MKDDLVELIRQNPGAIFTVDNDCWWMHKAPPKPVEESSDEEYDNWRDTDEIASDDSVLAKGDGGYGSGHCYGGDILQALAEIVGVKIESV